MFLFLPYRLTIAVFAQSSLILLEQALSGSSVAVGSYAVAVAVLAPVAAAVLSTSRSYYRRLAVAVQERDPHHLQQLFDERLLWPAPISILVLLVAWKSADIIISLFDTFRCRGDRRAADPP